MIIGRTISHAFFPMALILTAWHSTQAASFNCKKANTAETQLICKNPLLSGIDSKLGQIYKQKYRLLSRDGQKLLRTSENSWLQYVSKICSVSDTHDMSSSVSCLEREYSDRESELEDVAKRIGPYVFNRVDRFSAHPVADDGSGANGGFVTTEASYPQIDNVTNSYQSAWNKGTSASSIEDNCDGDGDYQVDYTINFANKRLIALSWIHFFYCHGSAHGESEVKSDNQEFQPEPTPMKISDIFQKERDWSGTLQKLYWKHLETNGLPSESYDIATQNGILEDIVDPTRWILKKSGISVSFDPYEGGCYACRIPSVEVSWNELKSVLAAGAAIK